MQEKSLALSKKAEKIILDKTEQMLNNNVHRAENTEHFSKLAKDNLNYFYESLAFTALDLGATRGKVLDLGTQFGLCGINLLKQGDYDFSVTSMQDSTKSIEISKRLTEEFMLEREIKWALGRGEFLPFRDKSFDLVISGFEMHHWENPVKVFNEIGRVMKRKGALVIGDVRREAFNVMMPVLKSISYVMKNKKLYEQMKSSFASSYNKSEVVQMLMDSDLEGFGVSKDVQFVYITKPVEKKQHVFVKFD